MVGETPLARDFFAGRYAEVVRLAFDARNARVDDADVAFVVGALTFLGRLEDAETCFEAFRARSRARDPRTLAAIRFFFGLAHARAGRFERARFFLVDGARARLQAGDAWSRAFVFQGLACQRYFTGRYKAAARHALRAQRSAHLADFPYAKMLATDLRGHALVQVGHARAGLSMLEQAKRHAEELGLVLNVFAIDCSIATYALKFAPDARNLRQLEMLLARPAHDSYSRHALLTEYAAQLALRGRGRDAQSTLRLADEEALRSDARRSRVSSLIAHLRVARFAGGATACALLLEQAKELLDESDATFRAELLGFEAFVARAQGDAARLSRALAGLRALAASHELHWAKAALEQHSDAPYRPRAFAEDQLTPLLHAVVQRDQTCLERLLALGLLGPVPELLGLEPSRRILIFPRENAVVLEDRGELVLRPNPPRWCPALLRLLASGDVPKEQLVLKLWGLRAYRPDRHDPLLRTAIHRLRSFLEPFGSWVQVTAHGYGSSVPVSFVGEDATYVAELELPGPDDDTALLEAPPRPPKTLAPVPATRAERLLATLAQRGTASVDELSRALDVSESTTLRELRPLLQRKQVRRSGYARATRYRLNPASE